MHWPTVGNGLTLLIMALMELQIWVLGKRVDKIGNWVQSKLDN